MPLSRRKEMIQLLKLLGQRPHYNFTLGVLMITASAYALQQTIVVPALPRMQRDLDTTTTWATWIFTVFLLSSAIAMPILGKLGDQYGKERLLAVSLGIFVIGGAGAAAAWNIWALIAFRFLQGASGAILPLSFGIIRDEFPREKVGLGLGLVSAILGVGASLGVVLSGLIVDHLSWRWIFVVGSISSAAALVLVHRFVPESPVKRRVRIDIVGALLLAAGLVCLLIALTEGNSWGWLSAPTLGLLLGSVALLASWAVVELRKAEPMVDMRMMAKRPVFVTNLTALIAGFSMYGAFVLVPIFVEMPRGLPASLTTVVDYGFGASVTKAGLYLLPTMLSMLLAAAAAGVISEGRDARSLLSIGMLFVASGNAVFAQWHAAPHQIMIAMGLLGVGIGFALAAMPILITSAVSQHETGIATGMNAVVRTVGGVVGGQIGAAMLSSHVIGSTGLPSASGFVTAFWISSIGGLVGAFVAIFVSSSSDRRSVPAFAEMVEVPEMEV